MRHTRSNTQVTGGLMVDYSTIRESLPIVQRMALSYAPAHARRATLGLFALDGRLAGILRNSREPMMAQLRLAWWRKQLETDIAAWPEGEPLLDLLRDWGPHKSGLVDLVNGWEHLTGAAPLPSSALAAFAEGRGKAFAALARLVGADAASADAARMGGAWAIADLAANLSDGEERQSALALARAQDWRRGALPRAMRPLVILAGLAAQAIERDGAAAEKPSARTMLTAMRLGLLGR